MPTAFLYHQIGMGIGRTTYHIYFFSSILTTRYMENFSKERRYQDYELSHTNQNNNKNCHLRNVDNHIG
jgi:hypothetical protein